MVRVDEAFRVTKLLRESLGLVTSVVLEILCGPTGIL